MNARLISAALFLLLITGFVGQAQAQNLLAQRADELEKELNAIRAARQEVLAPSLIEDVQDNIDRARKDIEKGKKPVKIASTLDDARKVLDQAISAIRIGLDIFQPVITARDDAEFYKASEFAEREWKDAEKEFEDAVSLVEKGKVDNAKSEAEQLTLLYRNAEFVSIRRQYVEPTQLRLQEVDKSDASKYAPETLNRARNHIAQADIILNRDRYAMDDAAAEIALADYEINHAQYLTELAVGIEGNREGLESVIHGIEDNFSTLAAAVRYTPKFDNGFDQPTAGVASKIKDMVSGAGEQTDQLAQELEDLKANVASLESKNKSLQDSIEVLQGMFEAEHAKLMAIEEKGLARKRVEEIRTLLADESAGVEVVGTDLEISLNGIQFPEGVAMLPAASFSLLSKIATVLQMYPGSTSVLKGPDFSSGASEEDIALANKRLSSISEYLNVNNASVTEMQVGEIAAAEASSEEIQAETEGDTDAAEEAVETAAEAGATEVEVPVEPIKLIIVDAVS